MDDDIDECSPNRDKSRQHVATALARAFLAGDRSPAEMRARGSAALGKRWPWLPHLALSVHFAFRSRTDPELHAAVVTFILGHAGFAKAFQDIEQQPTVKAYFPHHPQMRAPTAGLSARLQSSLPALPTPGDLANWLEIDPAMLDWLADVQGWRPDPGQPQLDHYHYRWMAKRQGGFRLIEAPKKTLKEIQRRILRDILNRIPSHTATYGCVRGRSVVDNAQLHAGSKHLLKMDLREFFVSIPGSRVHALFRSLGYPRETALHLTGLTTHRTPKAVVRQLPQSAFASRDSLLEERSRASRLLASHLPQGAPTSPALANLCAYRLDLRLAGAAKSAQATYSRYVDDLVFSFDNGNYAKGQRLKNLLQDIMLEEGFEPNWRKTRLAAASQAQRVTGPTVNTHPNLSRHEFDRLKAILNNCVRDGHTGQNRENHPHFREHLRGRIAWFYAVNRQRAEKLEQLFARIDWEK